MRTQVKYPNILKNQERRIVTQLNTFSQLTKKKKKREVSDRDYPNVVLATTRKDEIFVYFGEEET